MQPFFLQGCRGPLFALYHPPRVGLALGQALYLHPFAEEMNRSRRMAGLLARALADAGIGVLQLDLYGCGDSAGEFAEARWEVWAEDVGAALAWLDDRTDGQVSLIGLRLGALLALQAATRRRPRLRRVVLWQPPASGEALVTQFLRIRVAAALGGAGGASAENTQSLRTALAGGETVEIAGYALTPPLAAALDRLRLALLGPSCTVPIRWLELAGPTGELSPASQRVVRDWRAAGVDCTAEAVPGEPFWALMETTVAPELIRATLAILLDGSA